ncbi:DUF4377 domain-containing protein [Labilibaculum sp. K2S]|uniref:DUF4377 domain-containing protein n=1 Tax=Labilibaculum sp. K2S TaxID=3056386 RepID=UPI0025A42D90|nr:DUF4377 domain-containing protein [Labilibaculum sp. K2S]MDM8159370.1 DUF4377 domain-containing protein [Labilibaculum sp. K2S]
MKNKNRDLNAKRMLSPLCLVFAFIAILVTTGCNNNNNSNEKTTIINIEPETILNGTIPDSPDLVECMEATDENTNEKYYLALHHIKGFEYEKGYRYRLKVIITQGDSRLDIPTENFKLIEILSKIKIQTDE